MFKNLHNLLNYNLVSTYLLPKFAALNSLSELFSDLTSYAKIIFDCVLYYKLIYFGCSVMVHAGIYSFPQGTL